MMPTWLWKKEDVHKIEMLLKSDDIFHICSGTSEIGTVRLDCQIASKSLNDRPWRLGAANIKGDMCRLPFKSSSAPSVLIDPPYEYDFTNPELINELVRIMKPGSILYFIAPWVPTHSTIQTRVLDLWRVSKKAPYFKILSKSVKVTSQISDWV